MFKRTFTTLMLLMLTAGVTSVLANKYPIVATMGSNVVIATPSDQSLSLGDQFLILRESGPDEDVLAIGIIDKFQGKYCRIRVTETLLAQAPQEGDFVVPRDGGYSATPSFEETWEREMNSPNPAPATQINYSSGRSEGQLIIGLFSGIGQSDFKGSELYGAENVFVTSQSFFTPIGLQLMYNLGRVKVGAEVGYAVAPFEFQELDAETGEDVYTDQLKQLQIGGVVRVDLMQGAFKPYLRAGGGIYTGDFVRTFNAEYSGLGDDPAPEDETLASYKTSFGYNGGGGFSYRAWFVEGLYHGVQREQDTSAAGSEEGSGEEVTVEVPTFNANHWSVRVGLQISF